MELLFYDDEALLTSEQIKLMKAVFDIAADRFDEYRACRVELTMIDSAEMRELNRDTRGADKATDVLSFPALNFDAGKKPIAVDTALDYIDGRLYLGEIMICYDKAVSQAEEYGHSIERELAFLTAHAMLHLMGYGHETPEDEREMIALQKEILSC